MWGAHKDALPRGVLLPELRFHDVPLRVTRGVALSAKVPRMDMVRASDDLWKEYGARGGGMRLDFVPADAETTEPRLVVELDDRSHRRADARERDAFKDGALRAAGVPVLRVTAAGRDSDVHLKVRVAGAPGG